LRIVTDEKTLKQIRVLVAALAAPTQAAAPIDGKEASLVKRLQEMASELEDEYASQCLTALLKEAAEAIIASLPITQAAAPLVAELPLLTSGAIARCMVSISDPMAWGRMGSNCGTLAEEFARAVEAEVRAALARVGK
jgi:hypothetical protein